MSWLNDLEAVLSTLTSPTADSQPESDTADVDARRSRVADVLARHPALADLLPTSGTWHLHSLALGIPCTTEKLLSRLIDRLVETANHAGVENAVRTLDNLLSDAEKHNLPGLDLTFFRGLKLTKRWDIAPGLYALPFPMLKQQLKRRVQRIPDSLLYRIDPGQEHSVAVLVSEIRWGPVIVSTKGRTLSDPYPVETKLVFDHNPLLLVALMAVTLQRPLWILFNTLRAEPWVEDFLNVEGGGGSFFPSPTQLEPQTFPEPDPEAVEITERAFRQWDLLPNADRAVLALAITRLSESLSRTGMLAEQDRVLDVSIALEILYRLDHLEITYKLSSRGRLVIPPIYSIYRRNLGILHHHRIPFPACIGAPLRIRDLTEDDWLNGLLPSAAMLASGFPGVSRAPIELFPLQDRAQAISYSEYCHTAAARRFSWTRRRML